MTSKPLDHDCPQHLDPTGLCAVCGKPLIGANGEPLYVVERRGDDCYIVGFTERTRAEKTGERHLTVIIVPFVADGRDRGKWIVHDRTPKQQARRKRDYKTPSYNLFGGHCTANLDRTDLIGTVVPMGICDDAAKRELEEELLRAGSKTELEIWEDGHATGAVVLADPYEPTDLIPIGFTSYQDKENVELSFVYTLPIPEADIGCLIAADNYMREGQERNLQLEIAVMSETELLIIPYRNPNAEICDAITRLWLPENTGVYEKLKRTINDVVAQASFSS